MTRVICVFGAVGVVFCCGATASAALTFFTDRTAWETAVGSWVDESLALAPLGPFPASVDQNVPPTNVKFWTDLQSTPARVRFTDAGFVSGSREFRGFLGSPQFAEPTEQRVTLPTTVTAYGADYWETHNGDGLTLTVDNLAGDSFDIDQELDTGGLGTGFLGFTSDSPFTVVSYKTTGPGLLAEDWRLDDVAWQTFTGSAIPEPSTMILSAIGLLAMLGMSRTRMRGRSVA